MMKRDAQRQYVVIGTLAPIFLIYFCCLMCCDWGSGPEGDDVLVILSWQLSSLAGSLKCLADGLRGKADSLRSRADSP